MKDLLGNVKTGAEEAEDGIGRYKDSRAVTATDNDIEAQELKETTGPGKSQQDKAMADFFHEVSHVKSLLGQIKQNKLQLQDLHEKSKTISRSNVIQKLRDDMQTCVNHVNKSAQLAKKKMELLDQMNERAAEQPGDEEGSSNSRMRLAVTNGLKRKLKEMMGDFQDLRGKIRDEYRDVVERRVFTVTGQKPSEDELERMIETGEGETIFKKAILEVGRGQIVDTLAEIQERHAAVKELERSLLELHQIFLDMAVLVEAQGEMLNNIEAQVGKSVEYVAKGTEILVKAKELQKNTRKYMCWAIICLLILAIIIFMFAGGFSGLFSPTG